MGAASYNLGKITLPTIADPLLTDLTWNELTVAMESERMPEGGDRLRRSPLHLLHRASQVAEVIFSSKIPGPVTPRQLAVMSVVLYGDGLRQTDVVERTGIDRSTVAEIVRRLTQRGWVTRRRSLRDARAYTLTLSEAGERVLREAEPMAVGVDARVLRVLPTARREEFLTSLRTIVSVLERADPSGTSRPRR